MSESSSNLKKTEMPYQIINTINLKDFTIEDDSLVALTAEGVISIEDNSVTYRSYLDTGDIRSLYSFKECEKPMELKALADGRFIIRVEVREPEADIPKSKVLFFSDVESEPKIIIDHSDSNFRIDKIFLLNDGRVAIYDNDKNLEIYASDGGKIKEIDLDKGFPSFVLAQKDGGLIVIISYPREKVNLYGNDYILQSSMAGEFVRPFGAMSLYYTDGDNLIKYNSDSEEDELLFSYTEMGILQDSVTLFNDNENLLLIGCIGPEGLTVYTFSNDSINPGETKVDGTVEEDERTKLTFVGINVQLYQGDVVDFNKSNEQYEIKVGRRFSVFDMDQYNAYILSEKPAVFEILAGDSEYKNRVRNDNLYDLTDFIENSDKVKIEEYIDFVIEDVTVNDRIYTLPATMSFSTLVVPADSYDKKSWDVWEYLEYVEKHPDALSYSGEAPVSIKRNMVRDSLRNALAEFMDFDNGHADFESDRFKDYLRRINALDITARDNSPEERITMGEDVIMWIDLRSMPQLADKESECAKELNLIGFPSEKGGESKAIVGYSQMLCISNGTEYPEGAWDFCEQYLSKSFVESREGFPTKENEFAEKLNEGKDREPYSIDGVQYYPVTDEQIDKVKDLSERTFRNEGSEIISIISEEVSYYFDKQKSLDETCRVIQSRVQLLLDENR